MDNDYIAGNSKIIHNKRYIKHVQKLDNVYRCKIDLNENYIFNSTIFDKESDVLKWFRKRDVVLLPKFKGMFLSLYYDKCGVLIYILTKGTVIYNGYGREINNIYNFPEKINVDDVAVLYANLHHGIVINLLVLDNNEHVVLNVKPVRNKMFFNSPSFVERYEALQKVGFTTPLSYPYCKIPAKFSECELGKAICYIDQELEKINKLDKLNCYNLMVDTVNLHETEYYYPAPFIELFHKGEIFNRVVMDIEQGNNTVVVFSKPIIYRDNTIFRKLNLGCNNKYNIKIGSKITVEISSGKKTTLVGFIYTNSAGEDDYYAVPYRVLNIEKS